MKYYFNYSDSDYKDAINYDGTNYYNCPVTFNVDGTKFILGIGSSDHTAIKVDEPCFYIIGR